MGTILDYAFEKTKHFHVYKFEQLKLVVDKLLIELLDIYIRSGRKIFLAEVKSTAIYDNEKYSGDLDGFYRHDREGFFNSFGMGQLIEAITLLGEKARQFDAGFPERCSIKVYPALIVNEKALQTPTMARVFNDYFKKKLKGVDKRLKIQPLTIMHISDWENMEDHLHERPEDFFKIMKYHVREPEFIPPFYNTLLRKDIRKKPAKPWKLIGELVKQYQRIEASEPQ